MWWTTAWAWNGSGYDWAWQEAPVEEPFLLNADSFDELSSADEIEELFERTLRTWSVESEADLFLEYGGRTSELQQGGGDDGLNLTAFGSRDRFAGLAVATTWQDGQAALDCDLAVHQRNSYGPIPWHVGADGAPPGDFDLANTLLHEMGHCLGLAHSERDTAIMTPYSASGTGEARRHLTDDDREGLQALYGRVEPTLGIEGVTVAPVVDGRTTLELTVRNTGDGSAYDVTLDSPLASAEVGDVGAPTPVGVRVGPDEVVLSLVVDVPCEPSVVFRGTLRDARDREWSFSEVLPLDCEAEPEPETPDPTLEEADDPDGAAATGEEQGCGCVTGTVRPGTLGVVLLGGILVSTRRRRSVCRSDAP